MGAKIPRNINDLSQKGILNLFQDKEISLFGFKVPKIVESLNVELQDVKIEERRSDLVFLLEDDSLLHLEFQSTYDQRDLTRFIMYDILLHKQHKQRKVTTVIVYSAGIKRRKVSLNFSTLIYQPQVIFLEEKNGDIILEQLEEKFINKKSFNDDDILNLLFNCFMKSGILKTEERAKRLMKVATNIEEYHMREIATATIYGIAGKFLSPEQMIKLSEVFKMTDPFVELIRTEAAKEAKKMAPEMAKKMAPEMAKKMAPEMAKKMAKEMVEEVAVEMAKKMAEEMVEKNAVEMAKNMAEEMVEKNAVEMAKNMAKEKAVETAKKMLEKKMDIDLITELTNLNLEVINSLKLQI